MVVGCGAGGGGAKYQRAGPFLTGRARACYFYVNILHIHDIATSIRAYPSLLPLVGLG